MLDYVGRPTVLKTIRNNRALKDLEPRQDPGDEEKTRRDKVDIYNKVLSSLKIESHATVNYDKLYLKTGVFGAIYADIVVRIVRELLEKRVRMIFRGNMRSTHAAERRFGNYSAVRESFILGGERLVRGFSTWPSTPKDEADAVRPKAWLYDEYYTQLGQIDEGAAEDMADSNFEQVESHPEVVKYLSKLKEDLDKPSCPEYRLCSGMAMKAVGLEDPTVFATSVGTSTCCYALPGDDVVGVKLPDKETVILHVHDCPRLEFFDAEKRTSKFRFVLPKNGELSFRVSLRVVAMNRIGLMNDITYRIRHFENRGVNIIKYRSKNICGAVSHHKIVLSVSERLRAERLIMELRMKVPGILYVDRSYSPIVKTDGWC